MDGDIPNDRPGNCTDEDMDVWFPEEYGEDWDMGFEFELYDDEKDELSVEFLQPTIGSLYKATTNEQKDFTSFTIPNQWNHTASCSSGMATGITNQVPPKQLPVNSDLGPVQLKPEPIQQNQQHRRSHSNESPAFTPPTQCPGIMQADVSSQTQDHSQKCLTYRMSQNPQFRTDHTAFTQLEGVSSYEARAHTDTASVASQQHMQHQSHHEQLCSELNIPSLQLPLPHTSMPMQNSQPCMIPQERKPSSSKDFQIGLMDHIPQNTLFRSDRAAILLSEEPPLSEKTAHTGVQSAKIQHHSLHQQQPLLRYLLSQPQPTLMTTQNSQTFMILEERKPSSSKSLLNQPTESCPVQMISYETMQQFVNTFRNTRLILDLSKEEVRLLFKKLSGKEILYTWMAQFLFFSLFFHNMCQMKSLLEIWLDSIQNSRTTTHSFRNKSESTELGQQMQATRDSQMDGHLSNDRTDSATGETTDNQMSHEGSHVWMKDVNHVYECGNKYEVPEESLNSTESSHCNTKTNKKIVSTCSSRKKQVQNIAICFDHRGTSVENLLSRNLCLVLQTVEENSERISLEALQHFVNTFKKRRQELRLTNSGVLLELNEMCDRQIMPPCMWQFDSFNVFLEEICKLKPQLEKWLENVQISETDVSIFMQKRQSLERIFQWNQTPAADVIDNLAKQTTLDKDVLTFWFKKSRQIHEWNNTLTS